MNQQLIEKIDALLPQTQCGKCGFPACKPYAEAIVQGSADINQCPPGDQAGIDKLAEVLGIPSKPLNTSHGLSKPKAVAWINEQLCIGCTFCLQACPVDAIVGGAKQMHTVIAVECTGCELCVAPCPMDCIHMMPANTETNDIKHLLTDLSKKQAADTARSRYQFKQQRLERERHFRKNNLKQKIGFSADVSQSSQSAAVQRKQAIVQAAIKRAQALRAQAENDPSITR